MSDWWWITWTTVDGIKVKVDEDMVEIQSESVPLKEITSVNIFPEGTVKIKMSWNKSLDLGKYPTLFDSFGLARCIMENKVRVANKGVE